MAVEVRPVRAGDLDAWAAMRHALWPDVAADALRAEAHAALQAPEEDEVVFIACVEGASAGMAEAALRHDYVNGTDGSPVGFLEAWYVDPAWRGRGVGRALVAAVETWTRARGCTELASDALLDDTASHAAHARCGFEETERVVYFRRRLD